MNFNPIGDIAQSLMMRRRGGELRQELSALTQELASGKSRDIAKALQGNFSTISAVEHSIKLHDGYATTRNLAGQIMSASQNALEAMQASIDGVSTPLLAAVSSGNENQVGPFIAQGRALFDELVGFANTQHAGRFVFSGNAFDSQPIADSDSILSDIEATIAGLTSATDVSIAIDAYFDTPGSGFQSNGYIGGSASSGALNISSNQSIEIETTANDAAFRDAFKQAATLAIIDRGQFSSNEAEKNALVKSTAIGLIDASKGLIDVQAEIGAKQQRIETVDAQAELEQQMLKTIRNDITSVDPFEVATKLESIQTQLESLYLVTARTSRLNLSEYLR